MLECKKHGIPMDWVDDVVAWLCQYGCVVNPCEEISKMSSQDLHGL